MVRAGQTLGFGDSKRGDWWSGCVFERGANCKRFAGDESEEEGVRVAVNDEESEASERSRAL